VLGATQIGWAADWELDSSRCISEKSAVFHWLRLLIPRYSSVSGAGSRPAADRCVFTRESRGRFL